MNATLDEFAATLRGAVDDTAREFGGTARVLTDEAQRCEVTPSSTATVWTYQVLVPRGGDAAAVLAERIAPRLAEQGWTLTHRDTEREYGLHLARDGFDVGVLIGRGERADIVIGGSTPAVAVPA